MMIRSALIMTFVVLYLVPAGATLGEVESSVEKDNQAFSGSRKTTPSQKFSVHTITTGGNTINEYVSPSGMVFAVTWKGLSHPDLPTLLGSYFSEFDSVLKSAPVQTNRRPRMLRTSRMVIHQGGHMRNVTGHAFVPALVPSGVDPEELP